MNDSIEILDWDSNFFNLKVARIKGETLGFGDLGEVVKELKEQGVDLAYYTSTKPLQLSADPDHSFTIQLVDRKTTYVKQVRQDLMLEPSISTYGLDYPEVRLIEVAVESGKYSRFKVDKNMGGEVYRELYKQWIINSVNKTLAKEVLVSRNNNLITGVVTLGEKKDVADIGLLAVHPDYRGQGIGKLLMNAAESWSANNNYDQVQVVTQGDNLAACRLYESCGYAIGKLEYFYHLWLTDKRL